MGPPRRSLAGAAQQRGEASRWRTADRDSFEISLNGALSDRKAEARDGLPRELQLPSTVIDARVCLRTWADWLGMAVDGVCAAENVRRRRRGARASGAKAATLSAHGGQTRDTTTSRCVSRSSENSASLYGLAR
jgi:hypothetical protein